MTAIDQAREQLGHIIGVDGARATFDDCLSRIGHEVIVTADELMALAECLIRKGGIVEVVGRSLKLQALRHGAQLP
jgi:hypothetical protein